MKQQKREFIAYGAYFLIALAIMLPLLKPGFILTLDMIFTPDLRLPDSVTSSYLFHAFLYLLNFAIPSDIIQKIMLLSILILSAVGMHRLVRLLQPMPKKANAAVRQEPHGKMGFARLEQKAVETPEWGIYFASILYVANPFTYSRFMAGQYAVLLGFALLPWFARLLLKFMHRPELKGALKVGGLATLIGIVSIHTLAAVILLSLAALGVVLWRYRHKLKQFIKYCLVAMGLFVVLSSYWLVPLALGEGKTAQTIQDFTIADTEAFATNGGNPIARIGNVLRLQGFWAEDHGQFLLPQDRAVLWGTMALAIIALVITGAVILWRKSRPIAAFFVANGVVALLLAAGVFTSLIGQLPLLSGLREPHKIAALVVLSYSVFAAFGVNSFLNWAKEKAEVFYSIAAIAILILPFMFMRVMFWGFNGQLTPREYPAGWSGVNQRLQQDNADFVAIFLPWHQYMSFDFSGRIIANPAPKFFDKPVIVSSDPELDGATSGLMTDREKAIAQILSNSKNQPNFAQQLADQNIKYIIVAKAADYKEYGFLQNQPGLQQTEDYESIVLYVNTEWGQGT